MIYTNCIVLIDALNLILCLLDPDDFIPLCPKISKPEMQTTVGKYLQTLYEDSGNDVDQMLEKLKAQEDDADELLRYTSCTIYVIIYKKNSHLPIITEELMMR